MKRFLKDLINGMERRYTDRIFGNIRKYYPVSTVLENVHGNLSFEVHTKSDLFRRLILEGGYEESILRNLRSVFDENLDVIDVGANIGLYSIYFGSLVKKGHVYAFEPNEEVLELLKKNMRINQLEEKISAYNFGLGKTKDTVVMETMKGMSEYSSVGEITHPRAAGFEREKVTIEIRKLDDVVGEIGIRVGLIKIDTEGYDLNVLLGAEETIREHRPVIFMEISSNMLLGKGYTMKDVEAELKKLNYSSYDANTFSACKRLKDGDFILMPR